MEEIVNYFKKLYSKRERKSVGFEGLEWGSISTEDSRQLERPFEEGEIRTAIEDCEGDKSRRLSGSL